MFDVNSLVSEILKPYSKDKNAKTMKAAKDEFVELTGKLDEDSPEYESRLNSFEEWFIFSYQSQKVLQKFFEKNLDLEEEIKDALKNINHSVFLFKKINFFGKAIFVDLLNKQIIKIPNKKMDLTLVEGDLFTGRIMKMDKDHYLLKGICLLPEDAIGPIKKRIKKLRKDLTPTLKDSFLLKIEKLKNKSIHYGHIRAKDLFIFE